MLETISQHAASWGHHAPWMFFVLLILAGLNLPISADLILLSAASLAATVMPEHRMLLYFSVLFGCIFSAWGAYFLGRLLGPQLLKTRWFSKLLPPPRIEKMKTFYENHGLLTLCIGRFIPFGVRNGLFMSTGMAKHPFWSFALRDALACSLWCTTIFYLFYKLASHFDYIKSHLKLFNSLIFAVFAVAAIIFFWYKKRKKPGSPNVGA